MPATVKANSSSTSLTLMYECEAWNVVLAEEWKLAATQWAARQHMGSVNKLQHIFNEEIRCISGVKETFEYTPERRVGWYGKNER